MLLACHLGESKQMLHRCVVKDFSELIWASFYDKLRSPVPLSALFGACLIAMRIQCCGCFDNGRGSELLITV